MVPAQFCQAVIDRNLLMVHLLLRLVYRQGWYPFSLIISCTVLGFIPAIWPIALMLGWADSSIQSITYSSISTVLSSAHLKLETHFLVQVIPFPLTSGLISKKHFCTDVHDLIGLKIFTWRPAEITIIPNQCQVPVIIFKKRKQFLKITQRDRKPTKWFGV